MCFSHPGTARPWQNFRLPSWVQPPTAVGLGLESPTASSSVDILPQSSTTLILKGHSVGSVQSRLHEFLPPAQISDLTGFPISSDLSVHKSPLQLCLLCQFLVNVIRFICSMRRHWTYLPIQLPFCLALEKHFRYAWPGRLESQCSWICSQGICPWLVWL